MIRSFKQSLEDRRTREQREKPFDEWLTDQDWYRRTGSEYSKLFEAVEPKAWGRHQLIERLIEGKSPSYGYFFLANLIANGFIDTIVTTNFDDLVYAACTRWTQIRPAVYAYGNFASEIRFSARRPRILKLHGDFLYSRLKNTRQELQAQDPNMSRQLVQLFQEEGLVVVGYGGGDRSILRILDQFPEENDLYWCTLHNDPPNSVVQKLLMDKQGALIEIDSFDALMDEIQDCVGFHVPTIEEEVRHRRMAFIEVLRNTNSPNLSKYLGEVQDFVEAEEGEPGRIRRDRRRNEELAFVSGLIAMQEERFDEAIEHFEQALTIAAEFNDWQSQARYLQLTGDMLRNLGRIAQAFDYEKRALDIARRERSVQLELHILLAMARTRAYAGSFSGAVELAELASILAEKSRDIAMATLSLSYESHYRRLKGDLEGAVHCAQKARAVASDAGDADAESVALNHLGVAHTRRGDFPAAIAVLGESLELGGRGDDVNQAIRQLNLATALHAAKERDAALVAFEQAAEGLRKGLNESRKDGFLLFCLAISLLGQGRTSEGLSALREAVPLEKSMATLDDASHVLGRLTDLPGVLEAVAILDTAMDGDAEIRRE